ncbi:MAG: response regulator [Proteobacteria bacterium]|nr:response regulator [Pseudomonadota bacterium]MDA0927099.1 response regulator [Pseudomonadota bacterium]
MNRDIHILVVDDHESMRWIIKQALNDLGFKNVEMADDGSTALPKLKSGKFDFLVSDWNMPKMQGIDLLKAVRSDSELSDLPVLMIAEEAKKAEILEAARSGVSDYVIKPFNRETLKAKIENVFS